MTGIDTYITNWFNSDFGTGFSGGAVGNLCLIVLSLILAIVSGGIIGFEREYNGHAAGLRTHILVSLGSAVVMIISIYGFGGWEGVRDPARLAAQVVSGIGFLGAGAIIQNGLSIKGLTTATTIWLSMAIGLACGAGMFVVGILAEALVMVSLISMKKIEAMANRHNPAATLIVKENEASISDFLNIAAKYGVSVKDFTTEKLTFQGESAIRFHIKVSYSKTTDDSAFAEEVCLALAPLDFKLNTISN